MLVSVRGHIFPFTKKHAMNQLLLKKINLFATFFPESHICMTNDESKNPTLPSEPCTPNWQQRRCGSAVQRHSSDEDVEHLKTRDFSLDVFHGVLQILPPHLWEKVMEGVVLSHSWVKLHLYVLVPKSPFVGKWKSREIGRPIQNYSGIFVCFFTLPGVSLKMN